jgi:hypothetical protein
MQDTIVMMIEEELWKTLVCALYSLLFFRLFFSLGTIRVIFAILYLYF